MSRSAVVNYHAPGDDRPTYHLDPDGEVGKLVSPRHEAISVVVRDVRGMETSVEFSRDGVTFQHAPTNVASFCAETPWEPAYRQELTTLLLRTLGAAEVIVFDHTVREDDPHSTRRPARNVHTDYSPQGAQQRLVDLVGASEAQQWERGHYAFVNVWRPIGAPVNSTPLGFVRPCSVAAEDWVPIDLVYPDRIGHIMGLRANDKHEWIYLSKMTPDEVACFVVYDNRGQPSVGHSALDMVEDENVHTIRKSIESRTLVRF